jgi:hypothetical protein
MELQSAREAYGCTLEFIQRAQALDVLLPAQNRVVLVGDVLQNGLYILLHGMTYPQPDANKPSANKRPSANMSYASTLEREIPTHLSAPPALNSSTLRACRRRKLFLLVIFLFCFFVFCFFALLLFLKGGVLQDGQVIHTSDAITANTHIIVPQWTLAQSSSNAEQAMQRPCCSANQRW